MAPAHVSHHIVDDGEGRKELRLVSSARRPHGGATQPFTSRIIHDWLPGDNASNRLDSQPRPVSREAGQILEGAGEFADVAVALRRFCAEAPLDNLLQGLRKPGGGEDLALVAQNM
jgi:hypothetical protein